VNLLKYLLVLILSLTIIITACSSDITPGKFDSFAKCLTEKNVTMYGTTWCSHCNAQKKLFGNSFQYIDFVDCDKTPGTCKIAGVEGYPTWHVNGTNYPGEQTFYNLAKNSGCKIE